MAPAPQRIGNKVKGPGGGMADLVPAAIEGSQPAALSDGEYVIPADVVSMLGDGSTEEGTRILDQMVAEVRKAKTGTSKQADPIPGGMADLLSQSQ